MSERRFRNVFSRFAGGCPSPPGAVPPTCPPPEPCPEVQWAATYSAPSGFVQAIGTWDVPSPFVPVTASRDYDGAPFVPSTPVPLGGRPQYVPTSAPSSDIGQFAIGESPIGYNRAYHGTLTFASVGGYQVGTETPWPPAGNDGIVGTVTLTAGNDQPGWD